MKTTNQSALLAGSLMLVISAGLWIFMGITVPATENHGEEPDDATNSTRNCFVDLPATYQFTGEPVPLGDPEVYERLDREVHVNTFFHSSTIQHFKLANRWFPVIEPILLKYGVPDDLKYIAVAESGLRNVVSPVGAEGPWQIMKSTAKEYGLEVRDEVDERYHLEKATHAAAKYLLDAYRIYADWTLAAASYNMGMPALSRDLSEQKVNNYYDLYLNRETSRYVLRLIALKMIMEDPGKHGFCFEQDDLYDPWNAKEVLVDTSISSLNQFARENGTTLKMLKYLNPWLRQRALTVEDGKTYRIKIPG